MVPPSALIGREATAAAAPRAALNPAPDTLPSGLSEQEVRRRREQFGANAIPEQRDVPWRRLAHKLWAPVPWMLEAAIVLQLVLGEYVESGVIALLLAFNTALGYLQEGRARQTLEALRSRLALEASVRREGVWRTLPVAELVPGDIIKLSLGRIVGADVRLLQGEVLLDQSTLTGESLPVEAAAGSSAYAGSLVRRGEAVAEVTATGTRSRFGRAAELVRSAHSLSSQQQIVLQVVRNLAVFNGVLVVGQIAYAAALALPTRELIPLTLTAVLAAIPVALPATFTLAGAIGARRLASIGVLPTRLSAVEDAATLDVLCADKTGTLTQNQLTVGAVRALNGLTEPQLLVLAGLASSEGGQDPVDGAIRAAAAGAQGAHAPPPQLRRVQFVPFDPDTKIATATATDSAARTVRIVKGAWSAVQALSAPSAAAQAAVQELVEQGYRVLAVARADADAALLQLVGLIALTDPVRSDSRPLIEQLALMGVHTVMVTGDAPATAAVVARTLGMTGAICAGALPHHGDSPDRYTVFAGVLPEDKFHIVQAFQAEGHTVGMCGDGANDAPALRQAQMGIAVASATDAAKSAAGIVLTEPGLGGIVSAIREGRVTFQRILTYTMRSMTQKITQMLLLVAGLLLLHHALLTPLLMAIVMITGDFLAMSAATDHVQPSTQVNRWAVGELTVLGAILAACNVAFCVALLLYAHRYLGLELRALRTLAAVALVFTGQAAFYAVRTRGHFFRPAPSGWVLASSVADVAIITLLATQGWLMTALSVRWVAAVFGLSLAQLLLLDAVKWLAQGRLEARSNATASPHWVAMAGGGTRVAR